MPPFIGTPENFSPETLELLDRAMFDAWHEHQEKQIAALRKERDRARDDSEALPVEKA